LISSLQTLKPDSMRGFVNEQSTMFERSAGQCMSPKSAQRFWDNDMHQNKDLERFG